ncbi:sugar ABC transporter substrate-binding protein [Streptomyces sp. NBC_01022]|uniref:sugar ABC transporter substrate-binding protein n=1 Tax=Streptomyces sp. NBC_01022 TaxID=2903723 RepID=UPI002DD97A1D|nr:sugar ABC transporter substrate-binding protein [Streptomyces sp. NBC_01022]WRZ80314.1 sugar ABC transporter substrate-binding protein [Streptomyces sp. NBC_01022]
MLLPHDRPDEPKRPRTSRRALTASAAGAALVLSGCGGGSGAGHDTTVTLGFVNGAHTDFHTCLQGAVELAAENEGVKLFTANSQQDAAKELENIGKMTSWKVDGLIVQPVDIDALPGDVARARSAGTPVFLTSVVPKDTSDILGAVVVDLEQAGRLDAEWIDKDANGKPAEVGVVAGAPGAASDLLVSGFTAALPDNAEVVAEGPGMFDPVRARDVAATMIREHPGLDYAFVANEEMAFAVRNAFDAAGAKGVRIVTVNGTDKGLAAIRSGRLSATVTNSPLVNGTMAVRNTLALLAGKKAARIDSVPLVLVTKNNLDQAPQYCP